MKLLHKRVERAALYVTHDQAEAMTLADRLVVLDRGRIQQAGAPSELYDRPRNRFVASFLGSPPMNFLSGTAQRTAQGWRFVSENWQLELNLAAVEKLAADGNSASGREVELGIRPETVELSSTSGRSGENFAEISLLETLGDVNLVHLQAGSGRLIAKVSARESYRVGQRVAWFASWSQMHWFESLSGQRIDV
ncbi:MAG TPA: TOBE domain-containing protein [Pirellulaceae bacterium]|nr:TOBE domain-containing protein [Pirellulaceae bacterium]